MIIMHVKVKILLKSKNSPAQLIEDTFIRFEGPIYLQMG
jgi:hypothetical protein